MILHIKFTMQTENVRPHGKIKVLDNRGFSYLPVMLRRELDAKKGDYIQFFINANTALLIRQGASREDVLKGLEILRDDLPLRWKEENVVHKNRISVSEEKTDFPVQLRHRVKLENKTEAEEGSLNE